MIPNTVLVKNKFVVLGKRAGQPTQLRRWVYFNVDFRYSPTTVIETVESAIRSAEIARMASDPAPNCIQMDFTESYAHYAVRYWLTDLAVDDPTDSEVRSHIYFALQRAGISLSIPAHAIFMTQETEERKASKATHEMTDKVSALRHVELFRNLPSDLLQHLAERLIHAPYVRGDLITRQGSEAHWLYVFVDGIADVVLENAQHNTTKVTELGPGSIFGEWSLMTGELRQTNVIARTKVSCYRLNKEAFHELVTSRPEVSAALEELMEKHRADLEEARHALELEIEKNRLSDEHKAVLRRIIDFFHFESGGKRPD